MKQSAHAAGMSIILKGHLARAGFEYKVDGGTVEVTPESVVETLKELISPSLRELLDSSTGKSNKPDQAQKKHE